MKTNMIAAKVAKKLDCKTILGTILTGEYMIVALEDDNLDKVAGPLIVQVSRKTGIIRHMLATAQTFGKV